MPEPTIINLQRTRSNKVLIKQLDNTLVERFYKQAVLIRCIGSQDHQTKSKDELLEYIIETGTDRYDLSRKAVGHDYYKKWAPDFFAIKVKVEKTTAIFNEILDDFNQGAIADRGYSVNIDLILIYESSKCEMVKNVYEGQSESDLFTFKEPGSKSNALLAVIVIQ